MGFSLMPLSRTSEETPTTDTTFDSFFDADADAFDEDDFFTDFFTDFLLASMRRLNAFIGDTLVVGDDAIEPEGKMIPRETNVSL